MEMIRAKPMEQYYEEQYDEEQDDEERAYGEEQLTLKSKFYANVKWSLQIVLQHRKLEQQQQPLNRLPKKSLDSIYDQMENVLANLYKLEYQECIIEDDEQGLSEEEHEMHELLSSGIMYLLLAEIVLQESPKTIIVMSISVLLTIDRVT
jgi:hypothetical protein